MRKLGERRYHLCNKPRGGGVSYSMAEQPDEYELRKRAGEEPGDILAEEARLDELGVGFPLNMMHTLYYETSGDSPEELRPHIAEIVVQMHPGKKSTIRIYEQE